MMTFSTLLAREPLFTGSQSITIGAVLVLVAIAVGIVLYFKNQRFKEAVDSGLESISDMFPTQESKTLIRKVSTEELQGIMGSIGAVMTSRRFVPQSQAPGYSVYQKQESRGCLMMFVHTIIAIILLALCIVPGVFYIMAVAGKGDKFKIASVQVGDTGQGYYFTVKAPSGVKRKIYKILESYRIQTSQTTQQAYQEPTQPVSQQPVEEATKQCPYCAETIKAEAIKCKHCGSDLKDNKVS